jgi:hypothetical protein
MLASPDGDPIDSATLVVSAQDRLRYPTSVLHLLRVIRLGSTKGRSQPPQARGFLSGSCVGICGSTSAAAADPGRPLLIKLSDRRRLLLSVYTEVDEDTIRIISARRATSHERRHYEEGT